MVVKVSILTKIHNIEKNEIEEKIAKIENAQPMEGEMGRIITLVREQIQSRR